MGRRIALLIANDGYVDPGLRNLNAPRRDADQLAALLEEPSIGRFDEVRILPNTIKADAEEAIEDLLTDRLPDDLVLLYFACHGLTSDSDRLFFATIDTRLDRKNTTAVHASFVRDLLNDCQARAKILLLDCCYSGQYNREQIPRADQQVDVERTLVGQGTFVITSTTALAYSYEGTRFNDTGLHHSAAFTSAVIEGLGSGRADLDRDGVITPDELYNYVHEVVTEQLGTQQRPTMKKDHEGRIELAYAPWIDDRPGHRTRHAGDLLVLGDLLPPPADVPGRGLTCEAWEGVARLSVPVGRFDGHSGDDKVVADLSGRDGHVAVVGKPGSGKSLLLRTLIASLALTHTPDEVEFYLLEGAVNDLGVLRELPHVKFVGAPHELSEVAEAVTNVADALGERQKLFRQRDIASAAEFRELRQSGDLGERGNADIFLIIDGWRDFALEDADLIHQIEKIAHGGLHYGIHVVVTARQWDSIPPEIALNSGTRFELSLDDPATSRFDATLSKRLSSARGLMRGKPFRMATPHLEGGLDPATARDALRALTTRVTNAWEAVTTARPYPAEQPANPTGLAALLGIDDLATYDVEALWSGRDPSKRLRVPVGLDPDGAPVELDLKEATAGGMGPHGLCVGGAASGKSEFLRTLITGLAATHSPDVLNFALIDFQSRGAFTLMDRLPHTAALATGLEEDLALVDRVRAMIEGELARREASANPLEALPTLLLVVNEFSELLEARPGFSELLAQVGRVGRSLGIHMLLTARRVEEVRLRSLDSYLSYRVCLHTESAADSRLVLGVDEAYYMSVLPGSAILKHGEGELQRFRSAYVSAPRFRTDPNAAPETEMSAIVARLEDQGAKARTMWLPSLSESPTLDMLLGPVAVNDCWSSETAGEDRLTVPIGIVDKPFEQAQETLLVDFADASHMAVVGGPRSGKTTLVQSLVMALALTHTPDEAQFLLLDFSGKGLRPLAELPHVLGMADRSEPELVRRMAFEAEQILGRSPTSDVFLIVDGVLTARNEFPELARLIRTIVSEGHKHRVHAVLTANRWSEFESSVLANIGTRLELRLGEPFESGFNSGAAANVPVGAPGSGLTSQHHHFRAALPRIDGRRDADGLSDQVAFIAKRIAEVCPGKPQERIRALPATVPFDASRSPATDDPRRVVIGENVTSLAPAVVDFATDPNLLVYGDEGSGKTNLLRLIAQSVTREFAPGQASIFMIDYDRVLLNELVGSTFRYAITSVGVPGLVEEIKELVEARLPSPAVTPQQLRDRSWWSGPEVFVFVDDYERVATGTDSPLTPLRELLSHSSDIGLHLIIARTTRGADRRDPVQAVLRDLGTAGVVLSGAALEGPLVGDVRAARRPPGRGVWWTPNNGSQTVQTYLVSPG